MWLYSSVAVPVVGRWLYTYMASPDVRVHARFTHFPHLTGTVEEAVRYRGHEEIMDVAKIVARYNELIPELDKEASKVCGEESWLCRDLYILYDMAETIARETGRRAYVVPREPPRWPYIVIDPGTDVADTVWAVAMSPHDLDIPAYHFILVTFSRPVNRYMALRLAREVIDKLMDRSVENMDVAEGRAEIVWDIETGKTEVREVYA